MIARFAGFLAAFKNIKLLLFLNLQSLTKELASNVNL